MAVIAAIFSSSLSWPASLGVLLASLLIFLSSYLFCYRRRGRGRKESAGNSCSETEDACLEETATGEVTCSTTYGECIVTCCLTSEEQAFFSPLPDPGMQLKGSRLQ